MIQWINASVESLRTSLIEPLHYVPTHFTCIVSSFIVLKALEGGWVVLSLLYTWGNWDPVHLFPKVTWLVNVRAGFKPGLCPKALIMLPIALFQKIQAHEVEFNRWHIPAKPYTVNCSWRHDLSCLLRGEFVFNSKRIVRAVMWSPALAWTRSNK